MSNDKIVALAKQDLAMACIVETNSEAAFFIQGMQDTARAAEVTARRAARLASKIRHAG